jgi:hypothetical protein
MNMEEKKEYKMLGLYEKQSLIPSLIMFVTHALTSAYSIYCKVSMEDYLKLSPEQIDDLDLFQWYVYYPTLFFAFFFLGRYCDYLFRDSKNKRLFGFLSCMIVGWLLLLFFRMTFMIMFFWNQV